MRNPGKSSDDLLEYWAVLEMSEPLQGGRDTGVTSTRGDVIYMSDEVWEYWPQTRASCLILCKQRIDHSLFLSLNFSPPAFFPNWIRAGITASSCVPRSTLVRLVKGTNGSSLATGCGIRAESSHCWGEATGFCLSIF